ncbi:putative peptidase M20 family protein [Kineosphaera limosa NBRC 100340]|uniref:Putative peptidase M20 family protein n=1 Tax=Kineosphaera limosa NBRC 100340 TaxID=1184609 RepID=K6WBY9_9MICO|nr:putative peptidase M20 family protein [Kineosphaera limosa NBRC 100340]
MIELRRDLHANPELAWLESRTSEVIAGRLAAAGCKTVSLDPTGLTVDLGAPDADYAVGLRADIDALPLQERTDLPFRSRVPGVSHACGHDVHATALVGAVLALADHEQLLIERGLRVRALFQPAEESMPGGARVMLDRGLVEGLDACFALHCDPHRDLGQVGIREGAITAASDEVRVIVTGSGGHTSRPHLTQDVTYALAKIITDLPAALSRRLDPRSAAALVWGSVHSGAAPNVIPDVGEARGTLRMLDAIAWSNISPLLEELVQSIAAPYCVHAELRHTRGVPPVVNSPLGARTLRSAVAAAIGPAGVRDTEQSMGGEDFAWLLQGREGALARLGTRPPGGETFDLHRGDLVVDEGAIRLGAALLATIPFAARLQAQQAEQALLAQQALPADSHPLR